MIKKIILLLFCLPAIASAQLSATSGPDMADSFRADGKIYVVISVIALIFISLAIFLYYLERKVAKLEKHSGKLNSTNESGRH